MLSLPIPNRSTHCTCCSICQRFPNCLTVMYKAADFYEYWVDNVILFYRLFYFQFVLIILTRLGRGLIADTGLLGQKTRDTCTGTKTCPSFFLYYTYICNEITCVYYEKIDWKTQRDEMEREEAREWEGEKRGEREKDRKGVTEGRYNSTPNKKYPAFTNVAWGHYMYVCVCVCKQQMLYM